MNNRPRINTNDWALTQNYVAPDGEELWNLSPNEGDWSAVIHLQPSGRLYLTILRNRGNRSGVDQNMVADAMKQLSYRVYAERNIQTQIGVVASKNNAKLFSTVRKAGFKKSAEGKKVVGIRSIRSKRIIIFEFDTQLRMENSIADER